MTEFNVMAAPGDILIVLDDGHGMGTAGKRTPYIAELGRQIKENEFNREVVKYLNAELKRCGFKTLLTAPTDADTPLATRVAIANNAKADLLISIHFNALDGIFHGDSKDPQGFSAHVQSTLYDSAKFARIALKHLAGGTKQQNRGVVQQNLYMTRETKMPAVLFELGFMDHKREAMLMINVAFQKECAVELAKAVCEFYRVAYKAPVQSQPTPAPTNVYRVRKSWADTNSQIGAFEEKANAIDLAKAKPGYNVYDKDGKQVYPEVKEAVPAKLYRIRKSWKDTESQIGAFEELANAKELADKNPGYTVYDSTGKAVYTYVKPEPEMYRVRIEWSRPDTQIGAFEDLVNAKELADKKPTHKVFDKSGKVVYTPKPAPAPTPTPKPTPEPAPQPAPNPHKDHTPILGTMRATREQMITFVKAKNPGFKELEKVVDAFISVGKLYGVAGDMAFCQSIIETGWFKFDKGTAVTPDQHNYCGMGVTSKGMKGNSFDSVKEGVGAQIQHLFAYATTDNLPDGEPVRSPRMKYVTRGVAPHWEDLSNRWAMNAYYGTHIVSMHKQLLATVPVKEPVEPETPAVTKPEPEAPVQTAPEEEKINVSLLNKLLSLIWDLLVGKKK